MCYIIHNDHENEGIIIFVSVGSMHISPSIAKMTKFATRILIMWSAAWRILSRSSAMQKQMSNEKNPGWLGYKGDSTTQFYRDCNIPFEDVFPIKYGGFQLLW